MLPCSSCHIYGIWKRKALGDALNSLIGVAMQTTGRDNFYGKGGFSLCNTALLKLYCNFYWVVETFL